MLKKISIMFLALMFMFSVISISFVESAEASSFELFSEGESAEASSFELFSIGEGESGESSSTFSIPVDGPGTQYLTPRISPTTTVRTHPEDFPADIAAALVTLGGAHAVFQIPKALNQFLAWAGLTSVIVSRTDTTTYDVTMYTYILKETTMTSAGYYMYSIKNNKTGLTEYTKPFNIGKNGI